jgi:hypothetical protein
LFRPRLAVCPDAHAETFRSDPIEPHEEVLASVHVPETVGRVVERLLVLASAGIIDIEHVATTILGWERSSWCRDSRRNSKAARVNSHASASADCQSPDAWVREWRSAHRYRPEKQNHAVSGISGQIWDNSTPLTSKMSSSILGTDTWIGEARRKMWNITTTRGQNLLLRIDRSSL